MIKSYLTVKEKQFGGGKIYEVYINDEEIDWFSADGRTCLSKRILKVLNGILHKNLNGEGMQEYLKKELLSKEEEMFGSSEMTLSREVRNES